MWSGSHNCHNFLHETTCLTRRVSIAAAGLKGTRSSEEDMHYVYNEVTDKTILVGVMDGHGGSAVADYASEHFPKILTEKMSKKWHEDEKIKEQFLEFDKDLQAKCKEAAATCQRTPFYYIHEYDIGCTSVNVAVVEHPETSSVELVGCNIGDSRAIFGDVDGKDIELSHDHKPENPIETERFVDIFHFSHEFSRVLRIKKAGESIISWSGCPRIRNLLNVSRSFGDYTYKRDDELEFKDQAVTSCPDILRASYKPDAEKQTCPTRFVFLGCDGIFEKWKTQDVIQFIRERLEAQRKGCYVALREKFLRWIFTQPKDEDGTFVFDGADDSDDHKKNSSIEDIVTAKMKPTIQACSSQDKKDGSLQLKDFDVMSIVKDVLLMALRTGSHDNVTAMIVLLSEDNVCENVSA